jgi:ABC-type Fe3+-siderophore transport system permease subunit
MLTMRKGMRTLITGERVARIQGWFYLLTGIWPLVSDTSFQLVTGFKTDFWLAQTVGALLVVSGAVMLHAAKVRRVTPEIIGLSAGQAFALAVMDIYAVLQPSATPVYLLDVFVEVALIAAWFHVWRIKRAARRTRTSP